MYMQHKPGSFSLALFPFLYSSSLHLSLRITTDNTHIHNIPPTETNPKGRDTADRKREGESEEKEGGAKERKGEEEPQRKQHLGNGVLISIHMEG